MAASVTATTSANDASSHRRVIWPDSTTAALIRIWEDQLPALRGNTRNARIYAAIVAGLNAGLAPGEGPYTAKQVKQKMDNLTKKYRHLRRTGTSTGSPGVPWTFYWQLHSFLGSLPINDDGRVEESLELPVVNEAPDGSDMLLSWDDRVPEESTTDGLTPTAASSPASANASVPAELSTDGINRDTAGAGTSSERSNVLKSHRKRQGSAMEQLLALHRGEAKAAAHADRKAHKMRKKMVRLQEEGNEINASMVRLLAKFFDKENSDTLNKE